MTALKKFALAGVVGTALVGAFATAGYRFFEDRIPWIDRAGPVPTRPTLIMPASDSGVGRLIPEVEFSDLEGVRSRLSEVVNDRPAVIVVRDVGCPNGKKLAPRIAQLEAEYADAGLLSFLYVNVSPHDSEAAMREEAGRYGFRGRYVADREGAFIGALAIDSTTEVFLVDSDRTLLYRGAVDDQYGLGFTKPEPRRSFLREAIEAWRTGRRPEVEATRAPGCLVNKAATAPDDESMATTPTWHGRVSRILARHCVSCHRSEGMAPFALESMDEVAGRSRMIRYMVDQGLMPPWPADEHSGPWMNDRSMPDDDRSDLLAWFDAGFPEGDPADAMTPREWTDDWQIGAPDAIIEFPEATHVPAEGFVDYQFTYLKTDFDDDRWIQAVEIRPTVRDVVHHLAVWIGESNVALDDPRAFKGRHGGKYDKKGFLAIIVPGQGPTRFPEGTAKLLPKGAWLKFQMHYTPNGTEVWDQPKIGFVFADEPPRHEIYTNVCINRKFVIPPGAAGYEVKATYRFEEAGAIRAFHPHMHLRGQSFAYDLVYPNGARRELLRIDPWQFNWQLVYELVSPIEAPKGSRLIATVIYDNSPGNPLNPDPTQAVRFGQQSTDEMLLGYFEWYSTENPIE
ncbi:MAG: redoxin family protein [Phycisphaerales bacterium]